MNLSAGSKSSKIHAINRTSFPLDQMKYSVSQIELTCPKRAHIRKDSVPNI